MRYDTNMTIPGLPKEQSMKRIGEIEGICLSGHMDQDGKKLIVHIETKSHLFRLDYAEDISHVFDALRNDVIELMTTWNEEHLKENP
jgi:hypothetical protein